MLMTFTDSDIKSYETFENELTYTIWSTRMVSLSLKEPKQKMEKQNCKQCGIIAC